MDIRDELTPTILKMRNLADVFFCPLPDRPDHYNKRSPGGSISHLLNGLADEIESVLSACPGNAAVKY